MKPTRILTATIAALLCATPVFAVTDTWDGGGANDNLSTGANWADNTAPVSDVSNTDLIFGGTSGLLPNVDAAVFSVRGVTFNNTAGAFVIGGNILVVGVGGITNFDGTAQTFTNGVGLNAGSSVNATSGPLNFGNTVLLNTAGTVNVTGSFATSFLNFTNTGTVTKQGGGTMSYAPSFTQNLDLVVSSGLLNMIADGSTDVFSSSASIAVNGTSALSINGSLTLDGASLTRASGATLVIANVGSTFTVQAGGDVTITGAFTNFTTSTITVTGAGSTFSTTSTLELSGGSATNVLAGGSISSGAAGLNISSSVGDATVVVDGAGSSLGGGTLNVGLDGSTGALTFSNGSTGAFTAIEVAESPTSPGSGSLDILSGSDVAGTGLNLGRAFEHVGAITIDGAGSTLTISGAGTANIGAAIQCSGTLDINAGGTFTTGTGTTRVNATGNVNINGGTLNALGNLTLYGDLTRDAAGVLTLAAGRVLTVQDGGDAEITGAFTNDTASAIIVTGGGSTLSTTASINLNGDSTLDVLAGGSLTSSAGNVNLGGASGGGVLIVDAASVSAPAGSLRPGLSGKTGVVILRNGATGNFATIAVDSSTTTGSDGVLDVNTGATITAGSLLLANNANANTGLIVVGDAGSAITITGAGTATIGAASASSGTLDINTSGTFTTGTGTMTVNATGAVNIGGGTLNALGNLTLNGGQLTRDATGVLSLAAGKTLTVQSGGDAVIIGAFSHSTASTIAVTGAGSTFSTSGAFTLGSVATLSLASGGVATFTGGLAHNGTLNFSTGTTTLTGAVTQGAGAATQLTGNVTATFSNAFTHNGGAFDVAAGSTAKFLSNVSGVGNFTGAGTVEFPVIGTYNPGPAPAAISFGGNAILRGLYTVQIGGTTPGTQHDRLNIAGNLTLQSLILRMEFTGGFAPTTGQTFDIIDAAGTLTGNAFGDVTSGLLPGWEFTVDEIPASGIVRITAQSDAVSTVGAAKWDGGGANNNLATAANWVGDTAPASNLASTALIFESNSPRPAPNLSASFNARAVYFPPGSGAFTIGGQQLAVGTYGIYNESGDDQTFNCPVNFSGVASSTITADSGGVFCNGLVLLSSGALTLNAGNSQTIRIRNVSGIGDIQAIGEVILAPTSGTQQYDLTSDGSLQTEADGSPDVFGASASITLDGASLFIGEDLTFSGSDFSAINNPFIELGPDVKWTIQGGSDVNLTTVPDLSIASSSSFAVSGVGSTLMLPVIGQGDDFSRLDVLAGGSVTATGSELFVGDTLVDGAGASLSATALFTSNNNSTATFSNSATGTFGEIFVESLLITSGATVTTGTIFSGSSSEFIQISGPGSSLTLNGAALSEIRCAFVIENGGTFTSTIGAVQIFDSLLLSGATATFGGGLLTDFGVAVTIQGGTTTNLHGDITVGGGDLQILATGTIAIFHDAFTSQGNSLFEDPNTTARFLGPVQIDSGFSGNGTVEFHGGLAFDQISSTPIELEFESLAVFAPGNVLTLRVEGANNFEHDVLDFRFGIGATWGGTLKLVLTGGFIPAIGAVIRPLKLDIANTTGTFAAFDLPVLPAGRVWNLDDLYTTGELSVVAATPIGQWRADEFGTAAYNPEAADLADADFDGTENLLEYALGLDPLVPGTAGLPVQGVSTSGLDKFLTITFTRPLAVTDIDYIVEVGNSPASFVAGSHYGVSGDVPNTVATKQISRTIGATTETIVVRDNTPFAGAATRVIRLRVTNP